MIVFAITKEDIRLNRDNVSERLGFLRRVIHSTNSRAWLQEIRQRIGEQLAFSAVVSGGLHGDPDVENKELRDLIAHQRRLHPMPQSDQS